MWTRSKVIPDCFTVSSETSDIYKCPERLPIMPLLDLNIKSGVETFRGTEKLYWKVVQLQGMISKYYNEFSKISVHLSQSEFIILPVTVFKKD